MQELTNTIAVVAGGTGGVGEGIVLALLRAGATVVVPSRTEAKLQRLQAYTQDIDQGELIPMVVNLSDEADALRLQEQLRQRFGQVNLVVASLGGWWQGQALTDLDLNTWNRILLNNLTSHFLAVKALVPLLRPFSGTYVHINGFSAEEPYPKAAPVAMTAAAQKSMTLTLAQELEPSGIRVYELILGPIKTRDRIAHGHGRDDWFYPEEVGSYIRHYLLNQDSDDIPVVHHLLSKGAAQAGR